MPMKKNIGYSLEEIYKLIYNNPGITKPELADLLGVSLPAISENVNRLLDRGYIRIHKKGVSRGGRRPYLYEINPTYKYILGADIRKHYFYLFVSDLYGAPIDDIVIPVESPDFKSYVSVMKKEIDLLLRRNSLKRGDILSFSVSITGTTDIENKKVLRSLQLGWEDVSFSHKFEEILGIPVFIENDARIYAYNELESDDEKNVAVILFLGEGLGISFIINNKLFKGYTNKAGDNRFFGDRLGVLMDITRKNDILRKINELPYYFEKFQPDKIKGLNNDFEKYISEDIERFIDEFSHLAILLINIVDPKKLVLTGNIFDFNDYIYKGVRDRIKGCDSIYHVPQIKRSHYGDRPLERGIVKMVMSKVFELHLFKFNQKSGGVL